jgi:hypothetical protein
MSYTKKGPGRERTISAFKKYKHGTFVWIKGYPGSKLAKKAKKGTVGLKGS